MSFSIKDNYFVTVIKTSVFNYFERQKYSHVLTIKYCFFIILLLQNSQNKTRYKCLAYALCTFIKSKKIYK